ncbi:cupin domain-containing protein [Pseudomonas alliivorans]|nr:cupin domain-containing protein [Pseudomonas alliivorans]MEE4777005.1 cupin domain-containing protein [Pseudomonas alliivorans]
MLINSDFSRRAFVAPHKYEWVSSPQNGVERVMLDRVGAEKARATSIVRYAPDSYFPHHMHPGGEEILVLAGTFSEDDEHYPAGWYLRNPPDSGHRPSSCEGATIFVKLQQMRDDEAQHVRIDTSDPNNWLRHGDREICPLFSDQSEEVCLIRLPASEALLSTPVQGAELLVLEGEVVVSERSFTSGSWVRTPAGEIPPITAGEQGATVYLKTGHLADLTAEV